MADGAVTPGHTYNEDQEGTVFFQGVRDFGDRYPTPRVYCAEPTRVAETGSLLVAVRAPIGQVNLATQTTAIGRGLAALSAQQPSLALRALTAFPEVWQSHKGTGTVFESINRRDLLALKVPYIDDPELALRLVALDEAHLELTQEALLARATRDELLPLLLSGRVRVGEDAA